MAVGSVGSFLRQSITSIINYDSFGDSDGNVDITMDAANAQHANANASASVPRTLSTALDGDSEGNHETSCAPGTFIGKYAVLSKL
eukprot:gene27523-28696_t